MVFENLTLDEERALYGKKGAVVRNCRFEGPADGESALKECRDIEVEGCHFLLRYPFWHVTGAKIAQCEMTDTCRAALWYDENISISDSYLGGIKAMRESRNIQMKNCEMVSTEFGWFCSQFRMEDCKLYSEYPFLKSRDMEISRLRMKGKYSFQYVENVVIRDSYLDTKDAFWHSKNVTVMDSVVKGEYLAWYSEGLKLIRCKIIGTQPLCYARNLELVDCEMEGTDLSFEYSDVKATVNGQILSVKNPGNGWIQADSIGEIILDENQKPDVVCEITCREQSKKTDAGKEKKIEEDKEENRKESTEKNREENGREGSTERKQEKRGEQE